MLQQQLVQAQKPTTAWSPLPPAHRLLALAMMKTAKAAYAKRVADKAKTDAQAATADAKAAWSLYQIWEAVWRRRETAGAACMQAVAARAASDDAFAFQVGWEQHVCRQQASAARAAYELALDASAAADQKADAKKAIYEAAKAAKLHYLATQRALEELLGHAQ